MTNFRAVSETLKLKNLFPVPGIRLNSVSAQNKPPSIARKYCKKIVFPPHIVPCSKSSSPVARNPDKSAASQIVNGLGEFLVEGPQSASREQRGRQQVSVNPA